MSRIAALIDQAADSSRSLSDVLRQVKIVAARIGDRELGAWATRELAGYGPDDELPTYRAARLFPVVGDWSGPFGSGLTNARVSAVGVKDDFLDWFRFALRAPVAEMETLSTGDQDPVIRWDPWAVVEYERRAQNGEGGATIEMMSLIDARLVIPRNTFTGLLDIIRTRVLDLALALEDASPDAGEPDGPTVANEKVGAVVQNFFTVNGHGTNIATGDGARQRSTVNKVDLTELVRAARELGLSAEHADEFGAAVEADGGVAGDRTKTFVERVRSGAVTLAGDVAASVAATGLLQLVAGFAG